MALPDTRVLTVTGAAISNSVFISGLTFTGGGPLGASCLASCGAIAVLGLAQPLLVSVVISNNQAQSGGGVYADAGSPLTLNGANALETTKPHVSRHGQPVHAQSHLPSNPFRPIVPLRRHAHKA